MIASILYYAAVFFLFAHGLVHLIGVVVYWQLAEVEDFPPYKTTLLNGRLDIGDLGMRIYGLSWLIAALGFVIAAVGMAFRFDWWIPLLFAASIFSLVVNVIDWEWAKYGTLLDVLILLILIVTQFFV
jgi:hypothetical protein